MRLCTISGICLCLIMALANNGCKRMLKEEPLDLACNKSIQSATTLLEKTRTQLEHYQLQQIENLITAAKINQQHQEFPACHDKAQRALQLLQHDQASQ